MSIYEQKLDQDRAHTTNSAADKRQIVETLMERYNFMLDAGHKEFVKTASECDGFYTGRGQWREEERYALEAKRKPVLTINQIMPTINFVLGNQIMNRASVTFSPRKNGASDEVAEVLAKVFKQISDNNALDSLRSEVFADGIITGRGFYDARLDFSDSLQGEARITQLDPRQVLIDPDANSYDPQGWKDVITVQYMSIGDIEVLWGAKLAKSVKYSTDSYSEDLTKDLLDRQSFANSSNIHASSLDATYYGQQSNYRRTIAVIERQWRALDRTDSFVWLDTGDTRPVPETMDEEARQRYIAQHPNVTIMPKFGWRIRWTVVANGVLLHDEWSPYSMFTVIPYFPFFRRGQTIGAVEALLDPQRLLNKATSQELHILNTTANSGWKVKRNNLSNMSVAELEARGGETGLVVEVNDMDGLDKILPNQVPSGLDRMAFKATEAIKEISLVSDYMRGSAREDVSAKSVVANQQSGSVGMAKPMDTLATTDRILAKHLLSIIQVYYDDSRVIRVIKDSMTGESEDVQLNEQTEMGVNNDLTLGEYDIVITSIPARELGEDNEFEQAVRLRTEVGVPIPDDFIIRASRLREKSEILDTMSKGQEQQQQAAQQAAQLATATQQAELQKLQTEALLNQAKAQQAVAPPPVQQDSSAMEMQKLKMDYELKARAMMMDAEFRKQEMDMKAGEIQQKLALDQQKATQQAETQQMQARINARKAANKPKQDI